MDLGSNYIYIFIPFSSFCECVCVCFCVWHCLYSFAFTICPRVLSVRCFFVLFTFFIDFSACYHWWICFLVWLLSSFFFFITLKIFLMIIFYFYFNNFTFYFILFYFSLSFYFSPFYSEPCGWQSLGAPAGPQGSASKVGELSLQHWCNRDLQLHVISNSKNLPEISISSRRPRSTQRPAKYRAGHPMPNN